MHKTRLLVGSALLAALIGPPALAADAPNPPAPAASDTGVADIVVTAQRRSESILSVPLAITALSGDQLANAGIRQITDIQFTTPGYNVADGSGYTQIYIRGIGNNIFVGADPSVATFIDDVPRIYGSLVNDLVDIARVEVLKGAQGGLYGRNATGGVLNIITRQPALDRFAAEVRLSYGEHDTQRLSAYFSVPLSDKLALSLAGQRNTHAPYDRNIAPANPYTAAMFTGNSAVGTPAQTAALLNSGVHNPGVNNQNFYALDGKLLFEPAADFKLVVAGDYANKNDSNGNSLYSLTPAVAQGLLETLLTYDLGAHANLPAGFVIGNTPKFTVANGNPGYVTLIDYGASATATLALHGVDVTAISAYRHQHTRFLDDLTGANVPIYSAFVDNRKHYYYEELRVISNGTGPRSTSSAVPPISRPITMA